jgi:hypothetical protein
VTAAAVGGDFGANGIKLNGMGQFSSNGSRAKSLEAANWRERCTKPAKGIARWIRETIPEEEHLLRDINHTPDLVMIQE